MTKVGLISDNHANIEGLNAILDYFEEEGVIKILSLGDVVGYGPNPIQVLLRLMELEEKGVLYSIGGNHDKKILEVAMHPAGVSQALMYAEVTEAAKISWGHTIGELSAGLDIGDMFEKSPGELKKLAFRKIINKHSVEAEAWAEQVRGAFQGLDKRVSKQLGSIAKSLRGQREIMYGTGFGSRKTVLVSSSKEIEIIAGQLESLARDTKIHVSYEILRAALSTQAGQEYLAACKRIDDGKAALAYLQKIAERREVKFENIHGVHTFHPDPERQDRLVMTHYYAKQREKNRDEYVTPAEVCEQYTGDAVWLVCGDLHRITRRQDVREVNEHYHICVGSTNFQRGGKSSKAPVAAGYIIDTALQGREALEQVAVPYDFHKTSRKLDDANLVNQFRPKQGGEDK